MYPVPNHHYKVFPSPTVLIFNLKMLHVLVKVFNNTDTLYLLQPC